MTRCGDCGARVGDRATIYVPASGQLAKTLCLECQTNYPRSRQYHPTNGPTQPTYQIER